VHFISLVSLCHQALVELFLTDTRLVSAGEQNALSGGIEGECHPPNAPGGLESKLLQIGVSRPLQGVHVRASKPRAIDLEELEAGQNPILNRFIEKEELRLELVRQPNDPGHQYSLKAMSVKVFNMGKQTAVLTG
jgi:hypothetical protein